MVTCLGPFGLLLIGERFVWVFKTALCHVVLLGMAVVVLGYILFATPGSTTCVLQDYGNI